jgi:hypothetical protein
MVRILKFQHHSKTKLGLHWFQVPVPSQDMNSHLKQFLWILDMCYGWIFLSSDFFIQIFSKYKFAPAFQISMEYLFCITTNQQLCRKGDDKKFYLHTCPWNHVMYMYVLHETCTTKTCAIRTSWCINNIYGLTDLQNNFQHFLTLSCFGHFFICVLKI